MDDLEFEELKANRKEKQRDYRRKIYQEAKAKKKEEQRVEKEKKKADKLEKLWGSLRKGTEIETK